MTDRDVRMLTERVTRIEDKLDGLSRSVDERFDKADQRFEKESSDVAAQFAEQRRYSEFLFESLRAEARAGFGQINRRLDRIIDALPAAARKEQT